jgi:hypothetical protein
MSFSYNDLLVKWLSCERSIVSYKSLTDICGESLDC